MGTKTEWRSMLLHQVVKVLKSKQPCRQSPCLGDWCNLCGVGMAAVVSGDRREFSSWVAGVASNAPALRWTAKRIEQQFVLVNTLNKIKTLLKILAAVPDFKNRGKFIFRPVYMCLYIHTCVFV